MSLFFGTGAVVHLENRVSYGMSLLSIVLVSILLLVFLTLGLGLALFWLYAKALEEAHRDGWDMPS